MNPNSPEDPTIRNIRRLIWLYFWLLLLEGARCANGCCLNFRFRS